jgi:hypothetical protein
MVRVRTLIQHRVAQLVRRATANGCDRPTSACRPRFINVRVTTGNGRSDRHSDLMCVETSQAVAIAFSASLPATGFQPVSGVRK